MTVFCNDSSKVFWKTFLFKTLQGFCPSSPQLPKLKQTLIRSKAIWKFTSKRVTVVLSVQTLLWRRRSCRELGAGRGPHGHRCAGTAPALTAVRSRVALLFIICSYCLFVVDRQGQRNFRTNKWVLKILWGMREFLRGSKRWRLTGWVQENRGSWVPS